jgi:hypothetical protein
MQLPLPGVLLHQAGAQQHQADVHQLLVGVPLHQAGVQLILLWAGV